MTVPHSAEPDTAFRERRVLILKRVFIFFTESSVFLYLARALCLTRLPILNREKDCAAICRARRAKRRDGARFGGAISGRGGVVSTSG